MKKLELTKDELEKLYHLPPKDVEKETEFQTTYRMGRNSLVLELIKKIDGELTPYIEYHNNGNVWIKGQKNSVGQREGIEEWFYPNGNIRWRTTYKDGVWCGIQTFYDEQGKITETRNWKDGEIIEETKPKPQPDPQLIDSMAMRYTHDFGFLDEKHKESIRTTMKQLWEEVVGLGFYKPKSK
jgi:antitoxin component YwqK of YwqJK toxin-antitoxin module